MKFWNDVDSISTKKETVVHCRKKPYDVYIGRPSKWGNPFTHINDGGTLAKYVVGSRDEAIDAYRKWITEGDGMYLLKDLGELKGKVMGCWCGSFDISHKKLKCHGQILLKLLNED
jgi:hypothetical protein